MSLIVPILSRPIAELAPSGPPVAAVPTSSEFVAVSSPSMSTGTALAGFGVSGLTGHTWYGTDKPIALPFVVNEPVTARQLGWQNATAANNMDIGIYTSAWVRLVSTGSTACAGNNLLQFVDITDTLLPRGRYYLVAAKNGVAGASQYGIPMTKGGLKLCGVMDSGTSAFPLPDPLTNMVLAATATEIPRLYIALRALV